MLFCVCNVASWFYIIINTYVLEMQVQYLTSFSTLLIHIIGLTRFHVSLNFNTKSYYNYFIQRLSSWESCELVFKPSFLKLLCPTKCACLCDPTSRLLMTTLIKWSLDNWLNKSYFSVYLTSILSMSVALVTKLITATEYCISW